MRLPFSDSTVRSCVFRALSDGSQRTIPELKQLLAKRQQKHASIPAVRKAALELLDDGALTRSGHAFRINARWLAGAQQEFARVHAKLAVQNQPLNASATTNAEHYTFPSLYAAMRFWQNLSEEWLKSPALDNTENYWRGTHLWEGILLYEREHEVYSKLQERNIASYGICLSDAPLNRSVIKSYKNIGFDCRISKRAVKDNTSYVQTIGEQIIQTQYPQAIADALDAFFTKSTNAANIDLNELTAITKRRVPVTLTVIRNKALAEQINAALKAEFEHATTI